LSVDNRARVTLRPFHSADPLIEALLLLGPTGSGKTPQGRLLERSGYGCHFDFGHELRAAARGGVLEARDTRFVRGLLETHALLPDDRFDVAEAILRSFLRRVGFDASKHRLILNGLPRHVAQAKDMDAYAHVRRVVVLECEAETVRLRVARRRRGEGLDHAARDDDHDAAVEKKLRIYEARTSRLIRFYEERPGTEVMRIQVDPLLQDESIHTQILDRLELADELSRQGADSPPRRIENQKSKIGN